MKLQVLLEREDTFFVAECPAIPGCVTQGRTREEALSRIAEAIRGCLEVRKEMGLPLPEVVEIEV
jgi:predicted RNase H-like HicB family nuclease